MKNKMNRLILFTLIFSLFFVSCEKDEDSTESLQAIISELPQEVYAPGETVLIDASQSTGAAGATAIWTIPAGVEYNDTYYEEATEVTTNFDEASSIELKMVTNGGKNPLLRLEKNGNYSETAIGFSVAGSITLTSVEEGYVFANISFDTVPDYIIESDVTLSNCSFEDDNANAIVIAVADGVSITISGELSFGSNNLSYVTFRGVNYGDWKGLKLEGNMTGSAYLTIMGAGSSAYDTYEPAALLVNTGTFSIPDQVTIQIDNSINYDMYVTPNVTGIVQNGGTLYLNGDFPIHAPTALWGGFPYVNTSGIITFEGDANTQINFSNDQLYVNNDIYLKGGFATASNVQIAGSQTIYVEADKPVILGGGASVFNVTFDGYESANWQGIYLGTDGGGSSFNNVTINNAGSSPINTSAITTNVNAAVYVTQNLGGFSQNTVSNSQGYGLYLSGYGSISGNSNTDYRYNTFTDNTDAAISTIERYGMMFSNENTYTCPTDVPAIEVNQSSQLYFHTSDEWRGLGEGNFYYFTGNLVADNDAFLVGSGAHMKFADGKSIIIGSSNTMTLDGTSAEPIVIEGMNTGANSWNGILIDDQAAFNSDYATISNGGSGLIFGTTQAANIVIGTTQTTVDVTNTTISNSNAYGVVIESGAYPYDFLDAAYNNVFTNNASGDVNDMNAK